MAFKQRLLKIIFSLGQGTFGDTGSDTVTLSGLRASAKIEKAGGVTMASLSLDVYGMTQSLMNQLSTLGMVVTTIRKNSVTVLAGDGDSGFSTVFIGTIYDAYGDYQGSPDVPFRVTASAGLIYGVAPAQPSSYTKQADVAVILAGIAKQMTPPGGGLSGIPFENNGVSVILQNPYYSGSLRNQALQAVQHAGIEWNGIEDGTLAIWNPGGSRNGEAPIISPDTGMVGYPAYTSNGIILKTVFNPSIRFGGQIIVRSSLKGLTASETWGVNAINHSLDCQVPNGDWFSTVQAVPIGLVGKVAPSI